MMDTEREQFNIKDTPNDKNDVRAGCSNKTKTKNGLLHTRNTYLEAVKKDIEQSKTVTERNIRSNLSKGEKIALKDLTK